MVLPLVPVLSVGLWAQSLLGEGQLLQQPEDPLEAAQRTSASVRPGADEAGAGVASSPAHATANEGAWSRGRGGG